MCVCVREREREREREGEREKEREKERGVRYSRDEHSKVIERKKDKRETEK